MLLKGIFIGLIAGLIMGVFTIISDGIFYSKYASDIKMAKKYSHISVQLFIFLLISIFYGIVQGSLFSFVLPILPTGVPLRGLVFGAVSYLVLSRHFIEGFAFISTDFIPTKVSIYLTIEFFIIYILQGFIISFGYSTFGL